MIKLQIELYNELILILYQVNFQIITKHLRHLLKIQSLQISK